MQCIKLGRSEPATRQAGRCVGDPVLRLGDPTRRKQPGILVDRKLGHAAGHRDGARVPEKLGVDRRERDRGHIDRGRVVVFIAAKEETTAIGLEREYTGLACLELGQCLLPDRVPELRVDEARIEA